MESSACAWLTPAVKDQGSSEWRGELSFASPLWVLGTWMLLRNPTLGQPLGAGSQTWLSQLLPSAGATHPVGVKCWTTGTNGIQTRETQGAKLPSERIYLQSDDRQVQSMQTLWQSFYIKVYQNT